MPLKVGDEIPNVDLFEGTPDSKVNIVEAYKGQKILVFGVPGPFTPDCSQTHLPGYVRQADAIKAKGVNEIICISCVDPFVHSGWGEIHHVEGKVRMLSDPRAEFTKAADLDIDLTAVVGSVRSKRYAMLVDDGVIMALQVEPDDAPTGISCSLSNQFIKNL